MSTATATRPRRKRRVYPLPFAECSKQVQERIIAKWQKNPDRNWPDYNQAEWLTETLVNDLEYEFGIDVATCTRQGTKGRTYEEPQLCWGGCEPVEFRCQPLEEKFLAHGVKGCEYFNADIATIRELIESAKLIGAMFGVSIEWELDLTIDPRRDVYDRARWDSDCELTAEERNTIQAIADKIDGLLESVYRAACRRVQEIIDAETDYRNSAEGIREDLMNQDHYLFDQDGGLA